MSELSPALRLCITGADRPRLEIAGEVDLGTVAAVGDHLELLARSSTADIEVDMSGVTFCDAAGLHVLINAHHRLRVLGRRLRVVDPSAPVARLLHLAALDTILLTAPERSGTSSDTLARRICRHPRTPVGAVGRPQEKGTPDADHQAHHRHFG